MPLTEAQSLARHAAHRTVRSPTTSNASSSTAPAKKWHWLEHDPDLDLQQLKQLAADCDRFSPRVGYQYGDKPECLWLDASSHYRLSPTAAAEREKRLLGDVAAMFSRRGYYTATALADTLGAAWAIAHFGNRHESVTQSENGIRRLALQGPSHFIPLGEAATLEELFPLPIEALRLAENTVEVLHCLGIETIEQLWQLPRGELPARFGHHLIERMDQATGQLTETFEAYRTTPPLSVHLHLDRPTDRRELLSQCIHDLLEKLADIMKQQCRSALRVVCDLEMESGVDRSLTVGLFQPSRDPQRLLNLFEMQLERQTFPDPVRTIALTVSVNIRPKQGHAQWLPGMEDAAGQHATQTANLRDMSGLVEHLSCRLGGPAVLGVRLTAEPQIERAFHFLPLTGEEAQKKSTAAALRRHQSTAAARPLHIFTPPIRLHANHGQSGRYSGRQSWDQLPKTICIQKHTCEIIQHWGPERIETNWWRGTLVRRDYYRLEDTQGHHWWVFYDLKVQDWFVHGTFE